MPVQYSKRKTKHKLTPSWTKTGSLHKQERILFTAEWGTFFKSANLHIKYYLYFLKI